MAMTLPALVLMHGGFHAADCWNLTVQALHRLAPDLPVLAVDLPGRRSKPADLRALTIDDWVESVVAEIKTAGLDDVVIVGHSMAGLTVPGVVNRMGAGRVREMVLAAACVPPHGAAMVDVLSRPLAAIARHNAKKGGPQTFPGFAVKHLYLNGVPKERREFMKGRLVPESSRVMVEQVSRKSLPDNIHRTWILTLRDRTHPEGEQRASIDALGGVQTLVRLDTCHSVMVSEPELLAGILLARCRLYG